MLLHLDFDEERSLLRTFADERVLNLPPLAVEHSCSFSIVHLLKGDIVDARGPAAMAST